MADHDAQPPTSDGGGGTGADPAAAQGAQMEAWHEVGTNHSV